MANRENTVENPDQAQIDAWKKVHGELFLIEVAADPVDTISMAPEELEAIMKDQDRELDRVTTLKGYLKRPGQKVKNYAASNIGRDHIAVGRTILKDCWLGGDRQLLEDENYSLTAAVQAISLVDTYLARLKKL